MTAEVIPIPTEFMVSILFAHYCAAMDDLNRDETDYNRLVADERFKVFLDTYIWWTEINPADTEIETPLAG